LGKLKVYQLSLVRAQRLLDEIALLEEILKLQRR
jgi:hypothetical protein